ncbi:unnamed protein product [Hydatigera taeniaeformis]|uniref:Uncharacterized protein n=1 Tax=Hydatigena taeniaeformis TaxID=6205 RepID=A0A0R3WNQ5_HYDTA|nr:unnamed protein product [Hydatigera taeniaeformis]
MLVSTPSLSTDINRHPRLIVFNTLDGRVVLPISGCNYAFIATQLIMQLWRIKSTDPTLRGTQIDGTPKVPSLAMHLRLPKDNVILIAGIVDAKGFTPTLQRSSIIFECANAAQLLLCIVDRQLGCTWHGVGAILLKRVSKANGFNALDGACLHLELVANRPLPDSRCADRLANRRFRDLDHSALNPPLPLLSLCSHDLRREANSTSNSSVSLSPCHTTVRPTPLSVSLFISGPTVSRVSWFTLTLLIRIAPPSCTPPNLTACPSIRVCTLKSFHLLAVIRHPHS